MNKRLVFGCVADNKYPFLFQALRLVLSIRWFGGVYAQADIIVCCVDSVDSGYRDLLARWGAHIRIVPRIASGNPLANKIQFFLLPELKAYDTVVYLDCDILVVDDLSEYINYPEFQAKIADLPTVPTDTLTMLCQHVGLAAPEAMYRTTFLQVATIWYCNAGFLILPVQWIDQLVSRWIHYEALLGSDPSLLGPVQHHRAQAGLALAWIETAIPFRELPVGMNFPLHLTAYPASPEILEAQPIILHYHQKVDAAGYLLPSPYPHVQEKIELFNQKLQATIAMATPINGAEVLSLSNIVAPNRILITGMHRSGTSLITHLLSLCGLYLGDINDLTPADSNNLDGYWEHTAIIDFNDELLAFLNGSWFEPPLLDEQWQDRQDLAPFYEKATTIMQQFEKQIVWGWKDPRNSLLMPFWKKVNPHLKVVICVRNPLEVARSLAARNGRTLMFWLELWMQYYKTLLASTSIEQQIITCYEAYFIDPVAELQRVCTALGIVVDHQCLEQARRTVKQQLHRQHAAIAELNIPELQIFYNLYTDLLNKAGSIGQSIIAHSEQVSISDPVQSTSYYYAHQFRFLQLESQIAEQQRTLEAQRHEIRTGMQYMLDNQKAVSTIMVAELQAAQQMLKRYEYELTTRDQELAQYKQQLAAVRAVLEARDQEITNYGRELAAVRAVLEARDQEIANYAKLLAVLREQVND